MLFLILWCAKSHVYIYILIHFLKICILLFYIHNFCIYIYLAVNNFHRHPQLRDHIKIRIGCCMHRGRDRNGKYVYNLAFYSNIPRNDFNYKHIATFRYIHVEILVFICEIVDREKKDALSQENKACDGPSIASKSYNRRVIFRGDLFGSVYQFGCNTPPYAGDIDINPKKWYLIDSQRFTSFPDIRPESIDICIQIHVDHRSRVLPPLINNAWMYDPNMVMQPRSHMDEVPPMAATAKHPTDTNYPRAKLVTTSAHIHSLHPISHFNRVMMARFDYLQQRKKQQQQQQQPAKDQSAKPIPRYVSIVATSILWYNNID